jgi:hypothetical protein
VSIAHSIWLAFSFHFTLSEQKKEKFVLDACFLLASAQWLNPSRQSSKTFFVFITDIGVNTSDTNSGYTLTY